MERGEMREERWREERGERSEGSGPPPTHATPCCTPSPLASEHEVPVSMCLDLIDESNVSIS
jgi:hypothetical protein